jgi:hypothetical protein
LSDAELLAAYLRTRWTVDTPTASLEVRPSHPAPPPLAPSGIITAWNPASAPTGPRDNREADGALRAELAARGQPAWRSLAQGEAGDEEWDEPGWCLPGIGREKLLRLAEAYGQNAVLWIDPAGDVSVVCTRPGFCGAALGEALG